MALNTPFSWLITYDIADPKRLVRLHRFLVKQAVPVQYSVFLYEGTHAQMGGLMAAVEKRIDPACDDVRGYALPGQLSIDILGGGVLPSNVMLLSSVSPMLRDLLQSKA